MHPQFRNSPRLRGTAAILGAIAVPALCAVVLCAIPRRSTAAPADTYGDVKRVGVIRDPRITEISGIAPAHGKPHHYWVHNDSGGKPRLFLIHERGHVAGVLKIKQADAVDWEDIAVGPGPVAGQTYIYIADTGNNMRDRKKLDIYRVKHPDLTAFKPGDSLGSKKADKLSFHYEDGPQNCEAVVVHPQTADLYLVTKNALRASVYRLRPRSGKARALTARRITTMRTGFVVTGADLSPDGRRLLLRTYVKVLEYRLPKNEVFDRIFVQRKNILPAAASELGSESICYTHDGSGYVTSSEGSPAPLHLVRRRHTSTSQPSARQADDDSRDGRSHKDELRKDESRG